MLRIYVKNPAAPVEVVVPDAVKYGLLYNWYAATDARLITASGWTVPTLAEFETLLNYIDTYNSTFYPLAGGILKETGFTYFDSPNEGASNGVGFNARGSGFRDVSDGSFGNLKLRCYIRCIGARIDIFYEESFVYISSSSPDAEGYPIRLIKTNTSLTHGQSGTYTGNDGKDYRTIAIGSPAQEWLADNLAETKFRNGDYIHGYELGVYTPIEAADWAALTTAGLCAYNDDLNNV